MTTDYTSYVRDGKGRTDLTLLLRDPAVFNSAIEEMVGPFHSLTIDKVVALDALGFVFGAAIAQKLGVGLVLFRKGGKVSVDKKSVSYTDYTHQEKSFEVAVDGIVPKERVLIVDDWSETGAQLKAATLLVKQLGGEVVGISCFNVDAAVMKDAELSGYNMHSTRKFL